MLERKGIPHHKVKGVMKMDSFKIDVSIHRDKEDNWDIVDKAKEKRFANTDNLKYLGYETRFDVEIFQDGSNKILKINGKDVSSLNLSL